MAFGFFKKKSKDKEVVKDSRYKSMIVREVIQVAKESVNVVFEKPESDFNYQPGQFITIIKEVDGKKIRRAYSLCTTPFEDEYPAVTVKRVPGGAMSNHINDTFKAGDEIEIMEPMGMFVTEFNAEAARQVVFLGGGSGVTPLYALMRSVLIKEPNSKVALVYGNRSEEYIIFKKQLAELDGRFPGRVKIVHILEEDKNKVAAYSGRPTPAMIAGIADDLGEKDKTEYFICGPAPMMEVISTGLAQAGITQEQIRMESFEAGKTSPSELIDSKKASSSTSSEVTILLEGEEYVVEVAKKKSILDSALDENIDMPYSCQSGLCTACRAKCIEGEIDQEDAEGLSADEVANGYVLLCVGKPISDKIRVEVG